MRIEIASIELYKSLVFALQLRWESVACSADAKATDYRRNSLKDPDASPSPSYHFPRPICREPAIRFGRLAYKTCEALRSDGLRLVARYRRCAANDIGRKTKQVGHGLKQCSVRQDAGIGSTVLVINEGH